MSLLQEGEYTSLGDHHIWIGEKVDNTHVRNVTVREMRGSKLLRKVDADEGVFTADYEAESPTLKIELFGCLIEESESREKKEGQILTADFVNYDLSLARFMSTGKRRKKMKARTFNELRDVVRNTAAVFPDADEETVAKRRVEGQIETNKRLSLSLTCFAFTLMAIPFGIRSNRKESFWGIVFCIAMVFGYYFMTIVANSYSDKPGMFPDLLIWIPIIVAQVVGLVMLVRIR